MGMSSGTIIAVAAGGALGALARWGTGQAVARAGLDSFWATGCVNVVGSFGLGALAAVAAARGGLLAPFLLIGFFGAFTTFSTFALDAVFLAEGRGLAGAAAYTLGSVALGLAAFLGGLWLARGLA